ncbi:MAG: ATP-grasp domain-containing protein [Hespellia sp.]|nr:ATP-grasp domain-containing protein [Hespellia sp.]
MEKIVIIGANSFQNPLIEKVKEMGYEAHVFAWQDGSIGERTADMFYPISIIEKEQILEKCKEIQPKAVLTIASDLASVTSNYVAGKLGLSANSMECVERSTNKYAMRACFKEHGIPVPSFAKVTEQNCIELTKNFTYPLIVKPTDRSGSRSITKIEKNATSDSSVLKKAVARAVADSFENCAIVEEYIDGDEFSFESITSHGRHYMLAVTRKDTTGSPYFIETGHIEPSGLSRDKIDEVRDLVFQALDALGVQTGASHAEFRVNEQGRIGIIEIGARMGGDCIGSDLVCISTGYDFTRMVVEVGLGLEPSFEKVQEPAIAMIRFIMNQKDLDTYHWVQEHYQDCITFTSEIEMPGNHPVIDSSTRYGYYILSLNEEKEVEEIINYAKRT